MITIKSIDLTCTDTSLLGEVPNDGTSFVITTLDSYGATGGWADIGSPDINGVSTEPLTTTDWGTGRDTSWWHVTTIVDWPIDLTSGDVYLNIFRHPLSLAKHAGIIVDIKGI